MKLHYVTYNVRGISSRPARTRLKQILADLRPRADMIAIQEHKIMETNLSFLSKEICPSASLFFLPAQDGRRAEQNAEALSGKGGTILLCKGWVTGCISASGRLPLHGGLWIHVDIPGGMNMGIATLYAPNSATERSELWKALYNYLPEDRNWALLADYNMIEEELDQKGGMPKLIAGDEFWAWNELKNKLHLEDTFQRATNKIQFSWDNKRKGDPSLP